MHHATPGMHGELARQRQQALLEDARSSRQTERAPRPAAARIAGVALVAFLAVGAVGLSQAKAATTTVRPSSTILVKPYMHALFTQSHTLVRASSSARRPV